MNMAVENTAAAAAAGVLTDASFAALLEEVEPYGNAEVAPGIALLILHAPRIAARVKPGQFIHLRVGGLDKQILRRPFSVLDVYPRDGVIWILYQVAGAGTRWLYSQAINEITVEPLDWSSLGRLDAIGPLGRGWCVPEDARRVLLVAGGVGAAPLHMFAAECVRRGLHTEVVLGAQRAELLQCAKSFAESVTERRNLHICTDDGSEGRQGLTTDVVRELLEHERFDYIATCGPEPMQRAVARLAAESGVACEVSLERRMACGVGACLSCVVETTAGSKRACIDGPVFDAREVVW
jgi:dihydroorotate dehydrogenase electron transfer subunit